MTDAYAILQSPTTTASAPKNRDTIYRGIITLTKHPLPVDTVAAPKGDGAPGMILVSPDRLSEAIVFALLEALPPSHGDEPSLPEWRARWIAGQVVAALAE